MLPENPATLPPFEVTRASHLTLRVRDLAASKFFYEEVVGLVATSQDADRIFMRGVEEICHHSLVLEKQSGGELACTQIGYRVLRDADLDAAFSHFANKGLDVRWAEIAGQGRTVRVIDPAGVPTEFCAWMEPQQRRATEYALHKGAAARRMDHYQLHSRNVAEQWAFYSEIGFRTSDYLLAPDDKRPLGVFLHRKDNPWDVVIVENTGPRLHHFAYLVHSTEQMFRACELAGANGYGRIVDKGPASHIGEHGRYVYLLDPDGHRVELTIDVYRQMLDLEAEPRQLFPTAFTQDWVLPAQRSWHAHATPFAGAVPVDPERFSLPQTLEDYLAAKS